MKRTMTIAEISALVLLMLFALSGCGSPQEKADEAATGLTAGEPAGLSGESTGQNTDDTPANAEAAYYVGMRAVVFHGDTAELRRELETVILAK